LVFTFFIILSYTSDPVRALVMERLEAVFGENEANN
jgi:hypothetical protein